MAGKTRTTAQRVINNLLRNTASAQVAQPYVALYSTAPTDSTSGTEVSWTNYVRKAITMGAPSAADPTVSTSSGAVTFDAAGSGPTTVKAFGLFDAESSGNLLYWGTISDVVINSGDTPKINDAALTVSED